jgi:hypothetical protein
VSSFEPIEDQREVIGLRSVHAAPAVAMGIACSRKRGQLVHEDDLYSARFSKSGSFKWLLHTQPRSNSADVHRRGQGSMPGRCPSLVELCVAKVREVILLLLLFAVC